MIDEIRQRLAEEMVRTKDKLLRETINKYLCRDDWSLEDVMCRGEWLYIQHPYTEQFWMDGALLIEFYKGGFNEGYEDMSCHVVGDVKYRVFV